MAHPRISAQLPPDIDPTKAPVAFGRRGLPKLNEELQHPELLTRQRALMALCDLVHDPENAYQAIGLGFLDNLKNLLLDEDQTVRQKTTEVLYIMATHSIGRTNFLEHGVIPALAQLLDDPVDICRWNMHYALKLLSETPTGQEASSVLNRMIENLHRRLHIACIDSPLESVEKVWGSLASSSVPKRSSASLVFTHQLRRSLPSRDPLARGLVACCSLLSGRSTEQGKGSSAPHIGQKPVSGKC